MRRRREQPEPYQRYRAPLQAKWRPFILQRDGNTCKACGFRPKGARPRAAAAQDPHGEQARPEGPSPAPGATGDAQSDAPRDDPLEVAHITDAVAFVRAAGHHRAVTFSYRWDNLVTLCGPCHRASHAHRVTGEMLERRVGVERLHERLRRLRGWSSPFAVLPPALVPAEVRPRRSFHDTIRLSPLVPFPTFARYAADGGLIFGEGRLEDGPLRHPALDAWPAPPAAGPGPAAPPAPPGPPAFPPAS